MKILKLSVTLAIALLAIFVLTAIPASGDIEEKIEKDSAEPPEQLETGMLPPDFTVIDLEGNVFTLSEMAGEMPVLIDFWATWCPPCVVEIPVLVEFANMYEGRVQLVGISLDRPGDTETVDDNLAKVSDFVDENEIPYIIVYGYEDNQAISDEYFVRGIPALFIIGSDGKLLNVHIGYSAESDLIGDLEEELGL
ncbi:TlpA family protein disulfide reductase [bacterium]|nr:TlpA family protein disulfide reductase [bacterium]